MIKIEIEMCERNTCKAKRPPHVDITATREGGDVVLDVGAFSRAGVRRWLRTLVTREELTADEATTYESTIAELKLPEAMHRIDKVTTAGFPAAERNRFLGLVSGDRPAEPGSGLARYEECRGRCGSSYCRQFPVHGDLFMTGLSDPIARRVFTREQLLSAIEAATKKGLYTDGDAARVWGEAKEKMDEHPSPEAVRADLILASSPSDAEDAVEPLLMMLFSLQSKPDGVVGEARYERCRGTCGHPRCGDYPSHGVLRSDLIAGALGAHPSFSNSTATNQLSDAIGQGLIPRDRKEAIEAQIRVADLPEHT